jgi:hypothetical protein
MLKNNLLFFFSILFIKTFAQNIGIGTATPLERLHVTGNVRTTGLRIPSNGSIDLGVDIVGKEINAGRIGYGLFTANTLDIVGGGTNAADRRIRFWAEGLTEFTGKGYFIANVGIGASPSTSMLLVRSGSPSQLSLENSSTLTAGTTASIRLGGPNYTSALIQSVGISNNSARLAFNTGLTIAGGPNYLLERLTISNNGHVGINQINPVATLDVGGSIRFSGSNPAAFVVTLQLGVNTYSSSFFPTNNIGLIQFVRINHPFSNNNPNAILIGNAVAVAPPPNFQYNSSDGFWYIRHFVNHKISGIRVANWVQCTGGCISDNNGPLFIVPNANDPLYYDGMTYNVLIINQ